MSATASITHPAWSEVDDQASMIHKQIKVLKGVGEIIYYTANEEPSDFNRAILAALESVEAELLNVATSLDAIAVMPAKQEAAHG